jgi:hypothetical protein
MDSGNATYVTVYDGAFKPGVLSHLVDGLTNGGLYSFRVLAVNYNGKSQPSASRAYYACRAPAGFAAPLVISRSRSQMVLQWVPPVDLGGCSVTGYAVFRDDGEVGSRLAGAGITVELNSASDPQVRGKPSLSALTATAFSASAVG